MRRNRWQTLLSCESWATLKCERFYEANTAHMAPWEVESLIDRFIDFYNNERLHQGIGYVTPAERHDGRHVAIIEARRRGMQEAKNDGGWKPTEGSARIDD